MMARPNKPGFYWARPFEFQWWPILVEVSGTEPWLELFVRMNGMNGMNSTIVTPDDLIYSEPIQMPEIPAQKKRVK